MKAIAYSIGVVLALVGAALAWVSDVPAVLIIGGALLYGLGWACLVCELDRSEGT